MSDDGVVRCPECVDTYLPAEYPEYRRIVAVVILTLHLIFICVVALIVLLYRRWYALAFRRRGGFLLVLNAFGALGCIYVPIREIVGESNFPCVAHFGCTMVVSVGLFGAIVVRSLRLAAEHCFQARLARITDRDSILADIDHSLAKEDESSTLQSIETKADNPADTTVLRDSLRNEENEHRIASPTNRSSTSTAHAQTLKDRIPTLLQRLVLDVCHLHKPIGQVVVLLLLHLAPGLAQVFFRLNSHQAPITIHSTGCYFQASTASIVIIGCVYLSIQFCVFVYVCRRPDALKLREELFTLTVLLLLVYSSFFIFRSTPEIYEHVSPSYVFLLLSWCWLVLSFILPAWRARKAAIRVSAACVKPASRERLQTPTDPPKDPVTTTLEPVSVVVHAAEAQGDCISAPEGPVAHYSVDWVIATQLFCRLIDQTPGFPLVMTMAQVDAMKTRINDAMKSAIREESDDEALKLTAIALCCSSSGRAILKQALQKEWSSELLLYMLDVIFLETKVIELARLACGDMANDKEKLDSALRAVQIAAQHLEELYLRDGAMIPLRVEANLMSTARNSLDDFLDGLDTTRSHMQQSSNCWCSHMQATLLSLLGPFLAIQAAVFALMVDGPVRNLQSSEQFLAWVFSTAQMPTIVM